MGGENDPKVELGGEGRAPYPAGAGTVPPAEGAAGNRRRQQVEGVEVGVLPAPGSWRPHRHLRRC